MKSESLEMILDNMYFIASVDEKEEKVFIALDFEEAGRKYAELKSEGDAIIWHLKKKDLLSRIECDFGNPMEMVSEERLLRLMSLVVVDGKDSPSVSPTIAFDEHPETVGVDEDKILDDENLYKSEIVEAIENYNMNPEEVWKDVAMMEKIIIKTLIMAGKEDIGLHTAHILSNIHYVSKIDLKDIYKKFREIIVRDNYKDIKSKAKKEKLAAKATKATIIFEEKVKERKSSGEKLPESTKTEKVLDQIETLSSGEPDQRSIPRDLVDGWKERQEEPVSTPKVESSDEVKKPKSIPSSRVLLRGFLSYCKKRGLKKEKMHRHMFHVKTFLKFIKKEGRSILEIDERGVKEFESFLRDVRGLKTKTASNYFTSVRIFYDYTNSEEITNIDMRGSIRAWSVTRMMEIVGKPLTRVYTRVHDDESNTMYEPVIYEEVNQRILEGIEKLGIRAKKIDLVRFVLNIPKSDEAPHGSKAFIRVHIRYLVEHNILRKSCRMASKSISESISHKVTEISGIVSSEQLMGGFGQWLKKKGYEKTNRSEYTHVSIAREFIKHINDMGKTILDDDREHMIDLHKSHLCKRGLKETTIRTYIRGICVFYNYMDENPSEELSDQNESIERETQPFFNDFIQWLKRNHYKNINRIIGIVRRFKDCTESAERTILDGDRDQMIDLYRLYLRGNKYEKSTIKTYVGTIHLFYRFVDEMDEHTEKAGEISILSGNRICKYCGHLLDKKPNRIGIVDTLQFLRTKCPHCVNPYRGKIHKSALGKNYRLYTCKKCGHDNLYIYMNRNAVDRKSQFDWISEILGDDLQTVDMEHLNGGNDKKKYRRSLYTGINQKIFLELKENVSMSRLELIKSLFNFKGSIPKPISDVMSVHLRYLVDQGSISRIQTGVYTLVDDDKKVVNEKASLPTTKDEKTPHRELSAEDWIQRITKGEKPYAWISYGSMDDTRVVQRGQGTPIYPEINRRIMVEVRASKDPIKRSELIRPVFDLGWDERISQTVNTILNNHLRYLLHKNVVKQPARGYYESVPDNITDQKVDPIFERKIHEGVMR